jgi:hypothetical protein
LIQGYAGEAASGSNLRAFLDGIYGSQAGWMPVLQSVFDRWSELTGLRYVHELNDDGAPFPTSAGVLGVRGDLRLSGHLIDGTAGIVAYNFYPNLGDMVLDTGDGVLQNTGSNSLMLRNVLAHEHGHGMGLPHVCPINRTKLMEPLLTTAFDGPQHDDIVAANRGYGDRYEDADTPGTATPLGSAPSALEVDGLSVDDPGDVDYFSFTVGSDGNVTVSVVPVGDSYLSGPQLSGGGCSQGTLIDTTSIQDLSVEILDQDGSTVLASVDANGPGLSETLANVALTGGSGAYFALVRGQGDADAQLYRLTMDVTESQPSPESTLAVVVQGDGSGQVLSMPAGIDCGAICSHAWSDGTAVQLQAFPDAGSVFGGWSGPADCADGSVTLAGDVTCTATFSADPVDPAHYTLTVARSGTGAGGVSSVPTGIDCGIDCAETFQEATVVTLAATPGNGSVFTGWTGTGDCDDGQVTILADRSCTAIFDLAPGNPTYTLSLSLKGNGEGVVTSSPAGIDCGADCAYAFAAGARVTLTAEATPGSVFKHYRGDSDCRDGVITMNLAVSCNANFARGRRLRVKTSGVGGHVVSAPDGIDCRKDCHADFEEGMTIDLLALPDPGWVFHEWRGHPDCRDGRIGLDSDRNCHAVFTPVGAVSNLLFEDGFESGDTSWWDGSP